MTPLTDPAWNAICDMSRRYGVSTDAVRTLLDAVNSGGGGMAQFSHPELGGSGQWMKGGMTMVGDMFNGGLQGTVSNLCGELSNLLATTQVYAPPPVAQGQMQGMGPVNNNWWPNDLGVPSSTGGQNDMRYAVFPGSSRLAIERGGQVTVYDTQNHSIGGVQQQNGVVSFSSQFGTVYPENLPIVSGGAPMNAAPPQPNYAPPPQSNYAPPPQSNYAPPPQSNYAPPPGADEDPVAMIAKLADLHQQGALSDAEFQAKKAELLGRI